MAYFKKNSSKNGLILAGIAAAVAIGIGYGVASGAFSSIGSPSPASPDNQPMAMHIHARLSIKVDGKSMIVPSNIGIDPKLYKDHSLDQYGMKMPNMPSMPVMAPTHTHDSSGLIHVESSAVRDYTLGDLFNVWGVSFDDPTKTVKMFVNGQPSTEFLNYVLKDGDDIVIQYD